MTKKHLIVTCPVSQTMAKLYEKKQQEKTNDLKKDEVKKTPYEIWQSFSQEDKESMKIGV